MPPPLHAGPRWHERPERRVRRTLRSEGEPAPANDTGLLWSDAIAEEARAIHARVESRLAEQGVPGRLELTGAASLAVTPVGSEHDRRFRRCWTRLREEPPLLDEHNAMKRAAFGDGSYEGIKSAFFTRIAQQVPRDDEAVPRLRRSPAAPGHG